MLNQIERDPPVIVDGHDFAVEKRVWWEPFAGAGNMRELGGKEIFLSVTKALRRRCVYQQGSGSRRTLPHRATPGLREGS